LTKIVVLGAGIIGSCIAFRLTEAGADVTVLDAGRPGTGVSGTSYAWTNANDKPPRAYHDLNAGGIKAHARLRDELGASHWWHGGGSIEWDTEARQAWQRERVALLNSWGYAAEFIDKKQVAELEPDLDLSTVGDAQIAYFPEEGYVDPVVLAQVLLAEARRRGATERLGTRVASVEMPGGKVAGVVTVAGETVPADIVVNCLGEWANSMLPQEMRIPVASNLGLLVFTPPVPARVGHVVRNPIVDLRPDGAGRLMIHCNPTDATLTKASVAAADMPEAVDMVRRAAILYPGIAPVKPEAARIAVRPIPGDRVAVVGFMPKLEGFYMLTTHSGVSQGPLLAEMVADEVARGIVRRELADFRPARFFT
jgi:glycine/D-amino acid oxidase-like deaminating enzyme